MLILMVYTLVYCALKRGHELKAGSILACGLFKFHLVLPFALIFALRRRGRFLMGFAGMALVLAVVSVLVSGLGVIVGYPKMFFNGGYRALMGFQPEYAPNIRGLVYLIGNGKMPATLSAAIVGILSGFLWWVTAKRWSDDAFDFSFSAAVIATLLTGYHAFVYDLSLLLLPVAILCGELAKRKALLSNSTFNAVLIVLFIPPLHHLLIAYHVYAIMCLVMMVLFVNVTRIAARGPAGA